MKKNTKSKIIQTAKKLFNEHGYNNVSTKNISDAAGISKGNLTYHFKRKEDIIEAIVEELHLHYTKPAPPTTLEELNEHFLRSQKIVEENAFYFWHYTQLSQISDKIKNIQNAVIREQYRLFYETFGVLNRDGMLQGEEYPGQYGQIIQAVMLTSIYWGPHSRLEKGLGLNENFLDCIWGIIYPILTQEGKSTCQNKIPVSSRHKTAPANLYYTDRLSN